MTLYRPDLDPTDADFERALDTARGGATRTEWLFDDDTLDALTDVAADPTDEHVEAARAAWSRSRP